MGISIVDLLFLLFLAVSLLPLLRQRLLGSARELGLPISTDVPPEVYDIMSLFPQARQRRPSVEYIPTPDTPPEQPRPAGAK
jgi:hypothetical protein